MLYKCFVFAGAWSETHPNLIRHQSPMMGQRWANTGKRQQPTKQGDIKPVLS